MTKRLGRRTHYIVLKMEKNSGLNPAMIRPGSDLNSVEIKFEKWETGLNPVEVMPELVFNSVEAQEKKF